MISRSDPSIIAGWWRKTDLLVLVLFILLMLIGAVVMSSISPAMAARIGASENFFLRRHLLVLPLALSVMLLFSFFDRPRLLQVTLLAGLPVCLVLLVASVFSPEIKGSSRWLVIAGLSLQPSEIIKPFFVVATAWLLAKDSKSRSHWGAIFSLLLVSGIFSLLYLQPDIGQALMLLAIYYVQVFVAGTTMWLIILLPLGALLLLGLAFLSLPHVAYRLSSFFNDSSELGYQIGLSLQAVQHGGWLGVGLGAGEVKLLLPDSHADFILAVIAEELGIVTLLLILLIIATIAILSIWRAITSLSMLQQLIVSGLVIHLCGQPIVNLASNLRLLPTTGTTVPFLSYGGSAMLAAAISAGILLAINARGQLIKL